MLCVYFELEDFAMKYIVSLINMINCPFSYISYSKYISSFWNSPFNIELVSFFSLSLLLQLEKSVSDWDPETTEIGA